MHVTPMILTSTWNTKCSLETIAIIPMKTVPQMYKIQKFILTILISFRLSSKMQQIHFEQQKRAFVGRRHGRRSKNAVDKKFWKNRIFSQPYQHGAFGLR